MIKKEYEKPSMKVVKIQQHGMLCTSGFGAKSVSNSDDGLGWKDGGFADEEGDY